MGSEDEMGTLGFVPGSPPGSTLSLGTVTPDDL